VLKPITFNRIIIFRTASFSKSRASSTSNSTESLNSFACEMYIVLTSKVYSLCCRLAVMIKCFVDDVALLCT